MAAYDYLVFATRLNKYDDFSLLHACIYDFYCNLQSNMEVAYGICIFSIEIINL